MTIHIDSALSWSLLFLSVSILFWTGFGAGYDEAKSEGNECEYGVPARLMLLCLAVMAPVMFFGCAATALFKWLCRC